MKKKTKKKNAVVFGVPNVFERERPPPHTRNGFPSSTDRFIILFIEEAKNQKKKRKKKKRNE